jgi:hypothetical protein
VCWSKWEAAVLELTVLQAMRLKGRLTEAVAAACTGVPAAEVTPVLDALIDAGHATRAGAAVRITATGRTRLAELLDAERAGIDQQALARAYDAFDDVNAELKTVVTAWQLRGPDTPNDHTDATYDAEVIARLVAVDERFRPLLDDIVAVAARLAPYRGRFRDALEKVRGGDHAFVARPIADSYHTVWFELHEELIGLLGRTRAEEAAAGRAV